MLWASEPARMVPELMKLASEPVKLASEPIKLASEPVKVASEPVKIVPEPTLIVSEPTLIAAESIKDAGGRERAPKTRVFATRGIVLIRDGVGIERDFKKGATP